MFVHKIISSVAAAAFLPIAKSKLRQLARNKYAVIGHMILGSVLLKYRHDPQAGQQFIHLSGGDGKTYEFFTSDLVVYPAGGYSPGTPPFVGAGVEPYTCGHLTRVCMGSAVITPKMVGSWAGLNSAPLTHPFDGADGALLHNAFNNQKHTFRQNWATSTSVTPKVVDVPSLMTVAVDCRPDTHPPYSLSMSQGLLSNRHMVGDIGWDVRQTVYDLGQTACATEAVDKSKSATVLLSPPNWWRRGTTVIVNNVKVSIVTDAYNNFYFFKTDTVPVDPNLTLLTTSGYITFVPPTDCVVVSQASYMPIGSALATSATQLTAPYGSGSYSSPGWTILQSAAADTSTYTPNTSIPGGDAWASTAPQSAQYQQNQVLWNFRSDGLRAVGIVGYDRGVRNILVREQVAPGTGNYGSGSYNLHIEAVRAARYPINGMMDTHVPDTIRGLFDTNLGFSDAHTFTPALLELSITMGVSPEGVLSASVAVNNFDTGAWYVNADYAYKHPALENLGVSGGDLITGSIDTYNTTSTEPHSQKVAWPDNAHTVSVYRVKTGGEAIISFACSSGYSLYDNSVLGDSYGAAGVYGGIGVVYNDKCASVPTVPYPIAFDGSALDVHVHGGINLLPEGYYESCYIRRKPCAEDPNGCYEYSCSHPFSAIRTDTHYVDSTWYQYASETAYPNSVASTVNGCDLRSLSMVVLTNVKPTPTKPEWKGLVVFEHGKIVEMQGRGNDDFSYASACWIPSKKISMFSTTTEIAAEFATLNIVVPDYLVDFRGAQVLGPNLYSVAHQTLAYGYGDLESYGGLGETQLSTNPEGGIAICYSGPCGTYDKITYSCLFEDRLVVSKTSHRSMFNKAFKQNRAYSEYGSSAAAYGFGSFSMSGGWL